MTDVKGDAAHAPCGHPHAVPTCTESGPMIEVWVTACPDCGAELLEVVDRPQD